MSGNPHFLRPRSAVVYSHTRRMLAATSGNIRTFAWCVMEKYFETVAPDERHVPFREGGSGPELDKAQRYNAQQLARYMDGTIKALPADLEDAWVLALPEPYRSDCERELAGRRGMYAEKQLTADVAGSTAGLVDLTREFGELVQELAPALADGRLDAADLPYARRILTESTDLIAAVLSVQRQVTALLPKGSAPHA